MIHYILYNPLSNSGSTVGIIKHIEEELGARNLEFKSLSLIEIVKDIPSYVKTLNEEDILIVVGGDGTLHHFINDIRDLKIHNKVYLYKSGTGNDFSREFKKQKVIDITEYITNCPVAVYNGNDAAPEFFLNCSGFGVDGEVCRMTNAHTAKKKGINYFKNALKIFTDFKRYDLCVNVDGINHYFKNVWFITIMNGKYFGGGMKLSPDSDRHDDIMECYVVHSVKLFMVFLIFPLIFIGKHMIAKNHGITKLVGKEFKVKASRPLTFQTDGEVTTDVDYFELKR